MNPRGYRNRNPLNIERGDKWQGLRAVQTDARFCQFTSFEYGFRAAVIIIKNYIGRKPSVNTPTLIISRWAPPTENNTKAYIQQVCKMTTLSPDQRIDIEDKHAVCRLVWAMAKVECGVIYDYELVTKGYDLAIR